MVGLVFCLPEGIFVFSSIQHIFEGLPCLRSYIFRMSFVRLGSAGFHISLLEISLSSPPASEKPNSKQYASSASSQHETSMQVGRKGLTADLQCSFSHHGDTPGRNDLSKSCSCGSSTTWWYLLMGSPYRWNVFVRIYQVCIGLLTVNAPGIYAFLGHGQLENVSVIHLIISIK